MPSKATVYKILIASPADIEEERKVLPDVIKYWNTVNSEHYGVILEPVLWETHATPEMGNRPQAIINKQLLKKCDILIGIFWTRLGTPTGEAASGTVEEIEEFIKAGKPVSLYFSSIPIAPERFDIEQYKRLSDIKKNYEKEGLIINYKSIDELGTKLLMDITQKINSVIKEPIEVPKETRGIEEPKKRKSIILFPKQKQDSTITPEIAAKIAVSIPGMGGVAYSNTNTTVTVNPRVYDGKKLPPIGSIRLPLYTWDFQNFDEFFYDLNNGLGAERLTILSVDGRTIKKGELVYQTTGQSRTLKVVENNKSDGLSNGLDHFAAGDMSPNQGAYLVVGWQGQPYVGIKNHSYKLAKLIIEHGNATSDKMILAIGDTWDIGGGWTLTANSIDAKAIPRQVWLTLSKDGIKKDDMVVAQGSIYTYVEKSIGGESSVPLFVTYIDSIFAGAISDVVQLRYTWALDTSITEIQGEDRYGIFTVVSVAPIQLYNADTPVNLSKGIVDLMGNLKFKVADDSKFLRFHPIVLREQ